MSKIKTAFFCSNCGYESAKWSGKCPSCEQWNTFVEEVITKDNKLAETDWKKLSPLKKDVRTLPLSEVVSAEEKRKYMLKTIRKEHSKACNTWLICSNYPQEKFSQIRN